MESNDRETITRVLEAALASLKDEASGNSLSRLTGVTSIKPPSTGVEQSSTPVVILIQPNSSASAGFSTASAAQQKEANSCGCNHHESPLHPVFERFPLVEAESNDPAKMCFIEPNRACVGSGACKTRGY
jgi:hypothetical protein